MARPAPCPRCGRLVPREERDSGTGYLDCPACDESFDPGLSESERPPRVVPPRPAGVHETEHDGQLVLSARWPRAVPYDRLTRFGTLVVRGARDRAMLDVGEAGMPSHWVAPFMSEEVATYVGARLQAHLDALRRAPGQAAIPPSTWSTSPVTKDADSR